VKIKVRQPLAEMKVQAGDPADARAAKRFADQICDELNIKKLTMHEANGQALLNREVKPNPKTLGPKFGPRMKDVQAIIAAADAADLALKVQGGQPFELSGFTLEAADLFVQLKAPNGWAGVADRGTEVIIDTQITEELAREGMARDVVRQVQELRKTADLNMEDRIALVLQTDTPMLQAAIDAHRDYIGSETLAVAWPVSLDGEGATAEVKVDGQPMLIKLRRVEHRTSAFRKTTAKAKTRKAKARTKPSAPKSMRRIQKQAKAKAVATTRGAKSKLSGNSANKNAPTGARRSSKPDLAKSSRSAPASSPRKRGKRISATKSSRRTSRGEKKQQR
jgi:hypothetical protein